MEIGLDVQTATLPAFHDQPNEDYAAAAGNVVVLLDGAGISKQLPTGCRHSVHWFVQQLGPAVLRHALTVTTSLVEALRQAINDVRELHVDTCDLDHPNSPSATAIIVRVTDDQVEALLLADSTLVVQNRDGQVSAATDDRLEELVVRLRSEGVVPRLGWLSNYRNQIGGFWVAGADPAAADQALTASWSRDSIESFALLTDGAARIVDLFHDQEWPEVMATMIDSGPATVLDQVRKIESTDPDRTRWPRAKTCDDATIAYVDRIPTPG